MDGIFADAKELGERIRSCGVYLEYEAAKAVVDGNSELRRILSDYTAMRLELGDSLECEMASSKVYYSMNLNDGLRRFLDAERNVVELVCGVIDIITGACPVEVMLPVREAGETNAQTHGNA